jgi:hypothetical protein
LIDNNCGGVANNITVLSRFTYLGVSDPSNIESIDVLDTIGADYCIFDLTNLKLIQTIPAETSAGDYTLGMVLTLTAGEIIGDWGLPSYTLEYVAGENGILEGQTFQTVSYGSDGTAVKAVPEHGYIFVDWSDGVTVNPRMDINIAGNISVVANFAEEDCSQMDIGDECGGGIVAYLDGEGSGLIAALEDYETEVQWGCSGISIGTSDSYGTGASNTVSIVNWHEGWSQPWSTGPSGQTCHSDNNGTVAARVASQYNGGGYNDWFLPSRQELNYLFCYIGSHGGEGQWGTHCNSFMDVSEVNGNIGNFDKSGKFYHSSSEIASSIPRLQRFSDGTSNITWNKTYSCLVRPVRTF